MKIRFTRDNRMSGPVVVAKNGSYSVSLAPGMYVVSFDQYPVGMRIAPDTVRVIPGRARTVNFRVDTGIR